MEKKDNISLKEGTDKILSSMIEVKGYKYPLSIASFPLNQNVILHMLEDQTMWKKADTMVNHLQGYSAADEFCFKINKLTGKKFRLPTIEEMRDIAQIELAKKLFVDKETKMIVCKADRKQECFYNVETKGIDVQLYSPHGNPTFSGLYYLVDSPVSIDELYREDYCNEIVERMKKRNDEETSEWIRLWDEWYG